jgi:hypothetical protein
MIGVPEIATEELERVLVKPETRPRHDRVERSGASLLAEIGPILNRFMVENKYDSLGPVVAFIRMLEDQGYSPDTLSEDGLLKVFLNFDFNDEEHMVASSTGSSVGQAKHFANMLQDRGYLLIVVRWNYRCTRQESTKYGHLAVVVPFSNESDRGSD